MTTFNERFDTYTATMPEGTRGRLEQLADRSDLLSLEGITKVLDVLNTQPEGDK